MNPTAAPFWPCPNGCMRWCRDDIRIVDGHWISATNHHPRCEFVDASLIDLWSVRIPGEEHGCVVDSEPTARALADEDPHAPLEVVKIKMHREIYEHLGEFNGF